MKTPPTLSVGDAVVILLSDGSHQSATVMGFPLKRGTHRYVNVKWKTGPGKYEWESAEIHSSKWARFIVAVFPKDSKFVTI